MNGPELHTVIRGLIEQAQNTGPQLKLTQIAKQHDVSYDRLWRFMRGSNILLLDEAQRLHDGLSGKPLLPSAPDAI